MADYKCGEFELPDNWYELGWRRRWLVESDGLEYTSFPAALTAAKQGDKITMYYVFVGGDQ